MGGKIKTTVFREPHKKVGKFIRKDKMVWLIAWTDNDILITLTHPNLEEYEIRLFYNEGIVRRDREGVFSNVAIEGVNDPYTQLRLLRPREHRDILASIKIPRCMVYNKTDYKPYVSGNNVVFPKCEYTIGIVQIDGTEHKWFQVVHVGLSPSASTINYARKEHYTGLKDTKVVKNYYFIKEAGKWREVDNRSRHAMEMYEARELLKKLAK